MHRHRLPIGAEHCVAYYGGYCSGWAAAVRSALPSLIVHELERGESLDALMPSRRPSAACISCAWPMK
jgi:hypothetical protein